MKIDALIETIEQHKQQGNYNAALTLAIEWLNIDMNDYRLYEELADIYIFQGNLEKAEEVIHYARELHPDSGTGMFLEGFILSEKGEFEKALTTFEHANKLFPNSGEVLRNIGWCHVMLGNMQKGIAILKRAKALSPDDETIEQNLLTALMLYEEQNPTHYSV